MTDRSLLAQDPEEPFDVLDARGEPLGFSLPRRQIHAEGHWHRALHIWVWGVDERGPRLMLQRRGEWKDTWPGMLDATVGGHLRAGETIREAMREATEEIGIAIEFDGLIPLGTRAREDRSKPGIADCEIQDVFLHRTERELATFRPNADELAALICAPAVALVSLLQGACESLDIVQLPVGAEHPEQSHVRRDEFIPCPDHYFQRVAEAVLQVSTGASPSLFGPD